MVGGLAKKKKKNGGVKERRSENWEGGHHHQNHHKKAKTQPQSHTKKGKKKPTQNRTTNNAITANGKQEGERERGGTGVETPCGEGKGADRAIISKQGKEEENFKKASVSGCCRGGGGKGEWGVVDWDDGGSKN